MLLVFDILSRSQYSSVLNHIRIANDLEQEEIKERKIGAYYDSDMHHIILSQDRRGWSDILILHEIGHYFTRCLNYETFEEQVASEVAADIFVFHFCQYRQGICLPILAELLDKWKNKVMYQKGDDVYCVAAQQCLKYYDEYILHSAL